MPTFLAWNLRHGGGGRQMPAIVLNLLGHAPDVIVLSEFRAATGGQIAGVLADHGWRHQRSTLPPPGVNGMLVASRTPLLAVEPGRATGVGSAVLAPAACGQRYIEAELPELGLSLAGVHIPCDGKGLGREAVFALTVARARERRSEAFIVLGDFNAGRHRLDEAGATFTCTRRLGELASLGYTDAWRRLNPEGRESTWVRPGRAERGAAAGTRIDHAFISGALAGRLRSCRYSHLERTSGVSDHSALVLELA